MRKVVSSIIAGAWLVSSPVLAFEEFVVESIDMVGLQRVSESTVYNYLPFQIGDVLTEEDSNAIIHALHGTGFFDDIELARQETTLVIRFRERPVIGELTIRGNDEVSTSDLMDGLKDLGVTEGRTYDEAQLKRIRNGLEQLYFNLGRYGVKIHTDAVADDRNRVQVTIRIEEGEIARIRSIRFIGMETFTPKAVKEEFMLSESWFWTRWMKRDRYSKYRLEADLEKLKSLYFDAGYLDFEITHAQVSISPDKDDIHITISLFEGKPYTLGNVTLSGNLIVEESELRELITSQSGQTISIRQVMDDAKAVADKLGELGYAFSDIRPDPQLDPDTSTVDLDFHIIPGERYYVNQIHFTGNEKTRDNVLRREMTQLEGALMNSVHVEESKTRLDKTGFFQHVDVHTERVGENQVDLTYDVEEASSGQISGGFGYSTSEGMIFHAQLSNRNFMGTGENVEFDFNHSKTFQTYSVGYNNPYYTLSGISRGYNVFYSKADPSAMTDVSDYYTDVIGGSVNFGFPLSDKARFSLGAGLRDTDLNSGALVPAQITRFTEQNGSNYLEISLTGGFSYNSLDRYIFPTKGWRHTLSGLVTVPGSDLHYYRVSYNTQWYKPLSDSVTGLLAWSVGYGDGYKDTEALPFYQNFYGGGLRSVRGFAESSLGPKDSLGNPFGGNFMVSGTAQLAFNRILGGEPLKSVRPALFLDAGQIYALQDRTTTNAGAPVSRNNPAGVRASTGVAVTWLSPMGPLEFSLGYPLNKKTGDDTKPFNFSFGTYF